MQKYKRYNTGDIKNHVCTYTSFWKSVLFIIIDGYGFYTQMRR